MNEDLLFILNSALLGVGLAMDAFCVSLANGLAEPDMRVGRMCLIAGVYAVFQAVMPMTGWLCVHTVVQVFSAFARSIPWIALALLGYIGGRMIAEGVRGRQEASPPLLGFGTLLMQGVATSIDALSVGFTIADYGAGAALLCSAIIAAVTFAVCMAGLVLGRRFGTVLAGRASILGGAILIVIGLEIFLKGILG